MWRSPPTENSSGENMRPVEKETLTPLICWRVRYIYEPFPKNLRWVIGEECRRSYRAVCGRLFECLWGKPGRVDTEKLGNSEKNRSTEGEWQKFQRNLKGILKKSKNFCKQFERFVIFWVQQQWMYQKQGACCQPPFSDLGFQNELNRLYFVCTRLYMSFFVCTPLTFLPPL